MSAITIVMFAAAISDDARKTIESVLQQEFSDFDFVVATPDTAGPFFEDKRLQWNVIPMEKPGHFYNVSLDRADSEFFATIEPGVTLLPQALKAILCQFRKEPESQVIHSFYFQLDEKGQITRDQFRKRKERFLETIGSNGNFQDTLLAYGARAAGHFRVYRRSVLDRIGNFSKKTNLHADYEAMLRISEFGRIRILPEHLYSWKIDPENIFRVRHSLNLAHSLKYVLSPRQKSGTQESASRILRRRFSSSPLVRNFLTNWKLLLKKIRWRFLEWSDSVVQLIYEKILIRLPVPHFDAIQQKMDKEKRIAYYIWQFPVLSQTFVNRELSALKKSGIFIRVIADEPETTDLADENAKSLLSHTRYILPMKVEEMRKYKRYFFFQNPIRYLRLFFFVITHRYGPFKNPKRDHEVFSKAVYLAGVLKDEGINHVHSPWTDRCAFLALLSSKLLGIPYSVQSRAHEIHRISYLFGLREVLENAQFVVTNSEYNRSYLQSIVGDTFQDRIIRIYNGVDLERFHPATQQNETPEVFRFLCVARLIEQKGLQYLLRACRMLKDRKLPFQCEIVGGPEEELFMNYWLELRKLYRELDLADCVHFTGKLSFEKVLDKYKSSHIFVMPSVLGKDGSRDITPNSLIEAMGMKLPVISTRVTAIPEIVEDGVSGLLIPPEDENALADAMSSLIRDCDLRTQLGKNAREKVEKQFNISANVRHYIDLFSGL